MRGQFAKATSAIERANSVVLAAHVNPDGDTLGCVLALHLVLGRLGKRSQPLSADGVPDIYAWLPGVQDVERATERRDFDLAVVCDAGSLSRLGSAVRPAIEAAPSVLVVDHHVAEGDFGDIRILDSRAAATAELVWRLIAALSRQTGRDLADRAVADCVMTGIITDTGSFRFLNVTPETFQLAAQLQRMGALAAPIAERVFENKPFGSLKLLGRALDSLQLSPDGDVAWAHVTALDFEELGTSDADTEGIVSNVRAVKGALVGILFREIPGRKVRVSLRARDRADVNRIAAVFGGGGHRLAAGCSLDPPLEEAERLVVAETLRQLGALA